MQIKFLIIIGVCIILAVIISAAIVSPSINDYDDFVYQLKEPFDGAEPEEIVESLPSEKTDHPIPYSMPRNSTELASDTITISDSVVEQVCNMIGMDCKNDTSFVGHYDSKTDTTSFQIPTNLHIYYIEISAHKACYSVDGLDDQYCKFLDIPIPITYRQGQPVLLSKTLEEWRAVPEDKLFEYYDMYGNEFNVQLGEMAIREHIKEQLALQNITNANDGIRIFSGWGQSYTNGFNAVINGTDKKNYLVLGGAKFHQISDYFEIREIILDMPNTDSFYSKKPIVEILRDPDNGSMASNHEVILHQDNTSTVTFKNNLSSIIRIQEYGTGDVDKQNELAWIGPTILPKMSGDVTFEKSGYYEWNAREVIPFAETYPMKGSGAIILVNNNSDSLPFSTKQRMAGAFVTESDVPWMGVGVGNSRGVVIDLYPSVFEMIPDAKQFYTEYLKKVIPFDIPIIIE